MKRFTLALATCILACAAFAAKHRDWKTGVLESVGEGDRELQGVLTMPNYGYGGATQRVVYETWLGYTIRTDTMEYRVKYLSRRKLLKEPRPNLTVHGPVQFAVEGTKFYVQDEDKHEFQMIVVEKSLRQ